MYRSLKLSWASGIRAGALAGIFFLSCQSPADRQDIVDTTLLQRPPYAVLTDSIRHAGPDPQTAAGLFFRRGDLLSSNDRHEVAALDYQRAWVLQPSAETGQRYASTLSIIGRVRDAMKLLDTCIQKFPDDTRFPRMLGDMDMQSGKLQDAGRLFDELLKKDSLNFEAWYEKGLLLEKTADTAAAIASLAKAYALQPINTYGLELAHLYAEKKDTRALALCDQALRRDSTGELLDPFFIKGIYYANTLLYPQAIVQFDSCIRRDWKFTDAYLEKGIIFYHQKKYKEALAVFQTSTSVSDTYSDGYFWQGRCYEAMGKKSDALLLYEQAYALDKDFVEAKERIDKLKG